MRRTFWLFPVIACLVATGFVGLWFNGRAADDAVSVDSAEANPDGRGRTAPSSPGGPASKAEEWLNWLDERLQAAVGERQWSVAADYAYRKAGYFRSIGREDEAASWYGMSDAYWEKAGGKDARFYAETPPDPKAVTMSMYVSVPAAENGKLAQYEPRSGVYLGMFGMFDWQSVETAFGRYHPIALTYSGWRKDETDTRNYFPTRMIDRVKSAGGGAVQIGWEPAYGLDAVKDDDYVRQFARQAKAAGIPIFLRYASEMNGAWVPWYGDPAKYVEKFRLIAGVMREEAPNVVMVWSPNFLPVEQIDDYYPGDEYVDWVGFSLYATPFAGDKEDLSNNQIDYFMPLYAKYAHKPIMISEGGVSHYHLKTGANYAKWGESQIGNMYGFLPRMFPQVKAITYFNMSRSRSVSQKMDHVYEIQDNPLMLNLYRRLIQSEIFHSKVEQGIGTPDHVQYVPLSSASALRGKRKLFTYVKMPLGIQPHSVAVYQGERLLGISYEVPWEIEADFSALDPALPLTAVAYNGKFEVMARQSFRWASSP